MPNPESREDESDVPDQDAIVQKKGGALQSRLGVQIWSEDEPVTRESGDASAGTAARQAKARGLVEDEEPLDR